MADRCEFASFVTIYLEQAQYCNFVAMVLQMVIEINLGFMMIVESLFSVVPHIHTCIQNCSLDALRKFIVYAFV